MNINNSVFNVPHPSNFNVLNQAMERGITSVVAVGNSLSVGVQRMDNLGSFVYSGVKRKAEEYSISGERIKVYISMSQTGKRSELVTSMGDCEWSYHVYYGDPFLLKINNDV